MRAFIFSFLIAGICLVMILGLLEPAGAGMSAGQVSEALSRMARNGTSPQTLWNYGFKVFNEYPPERAFALAIAQGYESAGGTTPEQRDALMQGARYWRQQYDYWHSRVPAGQQSTVRDYPYTIRGRGWESTMPLTRPGAKRAPDTSRNLQ